VRGSSVNSVPYRAATVSTYVVRFLPKLAEFEISATALRQALE
jgi:hypothetical protein